MLSILEGPVLAYFVFLVPTAAAATVPAAAAAAATSTTAVATSTAATTAALGLRPGLVDGEAAAVDLLAVEGLMAAWASWSLPISTNPNPLDRPVSRSMMTCADCTVPCSPNICSSVASVTP